MNNYQKFKNDLLDGEKGERVFAFYLKKNKSFDIVGFNDDYRWDIVTEYFCKRITFEVKTDRYEFFKGVKTNNMFIETSCSGKRSGIQKTEADVFVYFTPDYEEAFLISVSKLKALLIEHPEYFRYTTGGGDGARVNGYLLNREKYKHLFKVLSIPRYRCWNIKISDV